MKLRYNVKKKKKDVELVIKQIQGLEGWFGENKGTKQLTVNGRIPLKGYFWVHAIAGLPPGNYQLVIEAIIGSRAVASASVNVTVKGGPSGIDMDPYIINEIINLVEVQVEDRLKAKNIPPPPNLTVIIKNEAMNYIHNNNIVDVGDVNVKTIVDEVVDIVVESRGGGGGEKKETISISVAAHPQDAGTVTHHGKNTLQKNPSDTLEITAIPNDGYNFEEWQIDGSTPNLANVSPDGRTVKVPKNNDHNVLAIFSGGEERDELIVEAEEGGNSIPVPVTLDGNLAGNTRISQNVSKGEHTVKIPPKSTGTGVPSGGKFKRWKGKAVSDPKSPSTHVNVKGRTVITAVYEGEGNLKVRAENESGKKLRAPFSTTAASGSHRTPENLDVESNVPHEISMEEEFSFGGYNYKFKQWKDGKKIPTTSITVPENHSRTRTAIYEAEEKPPPPTPEPEELEPLDLGGRYLWKLLLLGVAVMLAATDMIIFYGAIGLTFPESGLGNAVEYSEAQGPASFVTLLDPSGGKFASIFFTGMKIEMGDLQLDEDTDEESNEKEQLNFWPLLVLQAIGGMLLILFIFIFYEIYDKSGFNGVFVVSLIFILIGYMFVGPYSGMVRASAREAAAPIKEGVKVVFKTARDFAIMALYPDRWREIQEQRNAKPDNKGVSNKGLEITGFHVMPTPIRKGTQFSVVNTIENKGEHTADFINVALRCNKNCETNTEGKAFAMISNPVKKRLRSGAGETIRWGKINATGPAREYIELGFSLSYAYPSSSILETQIMADSEIERRQLQEGMQFTPKAATSKPGPAQISLNVGPQPLQSGQRVDLLISVLNSRRDGNVILPKDTTFTVNIPDSLRKEGTDIKCTSPYIEKADGNHKWKITHNWNIPPGQMGDTFQFLCEFTTSLMTNAPSRTNVISVSMTPYFYELSMTKTLPIKPPLGIFAESAGLEECKEGFDCVLNEKACEELCQENGGVADGPLGSYYVYDTVTEIAEKDWVYCDNNAENQYCCKCQGKEDDAQSS